MNRRRVRAHIFIALVVAIAIVMAARAGDRIEEPAVPDRDRFRAWLDTLEHTDGETAGLYPYYRCVEDGLQASPHPFLSPMVSAKCILFWLEEGQTQRAARIGEALLYWQSKVARQAHPHAAGALPSEIVMEGGAWTGGERFYSGDNLVVLEAMLSLYERTRRPEFLDGARTIAGWLKDVMGHGEKYGAWLEPHFAPMQFVNADGSFDNRIFTNTPFLWIGALRRFGEITTDSTYIEHYLLARAFFLQGQSPQGVWYDHYDPGYPPQSYRAANWEWYGAGGVVVADNAARAALGALRVGARDQAERFADWLRPKDGAVFAYLDADTGDSRFAPSDGPYYDIVVSGLWRILARELGRDKAAMAANRFLARTQSAGGGWYWGLRKRHLQPVQKSEAVLTGLWAVSDMAR